MVDRNVRILVVDDITMMRAVAVKALNVLGFQDIVEAEDGLQGWHTLVHSTKPIQLIVSDLNMPNGTGIELLSWLRKDPTFQHLLFILVTTGPTPDQLQAAQAEGVNALLLKPLSVASLRVPLTKLSLHSHQQNNG